MSNTAPAKQVCKPKKLPFVIMCILSAIVAVLNVLLCVLVPKYYTTINSFLYKGPDADKVAAFRQASADMTQKVESEGIVMLEIRTRLCLSLPEAKSISLVMALVTLSMAATVPVPVTAAITLPWSRA